MIIRVWHGWTTPANAPLYQELLLREVFPRIAGRRLPGYLGIRLDRVDCGDEIEFVTTMAFESIDAVRAFAGEDYTTSVVPEAARKVLARYDAAATHYERVAEFDGSGLPVPA